MKIKNNDYTLKVKGLILNRKIIKALNNYKFTIYWNDLECRYWIYDFKINNIWFTSEKIDMNNRIIYLIKYYKNLRGHYENF